MTNSPPRWVHSVVCTISSQRKAWPPWLESMSSIETDYRARLFLHIVPIRIPGLLATKRMEQNQIHVEIGSCILLKQKVLTSWMLPFMTGRFDQKAAQSYSTIFI